MFGGIILEPFVGDAEASAVFNTGHVSGGIGCFVRILILQFFARLGVSYRVRHENNPSRGSWSFVERVAAIMGILLFIIQVAQWIYPWLL